MDYKRKSNNDVQKRSYYVTSTNSAEKCDGNRHYQRVSKEEKLLKVLILPMTVPQNILPGVNFKKPTNRVLI